MFDAARESTDSDTAAVPVPAGPFSPGGGPRVEAGSLPERWESLRGRQAFAAVYTQGTRRRVGGITVVGRTGEADVPKVGIVTSRRRLGSAVHRNRARRRIRAALDRIDLPPRLEAVVIADRRVLDVPFTTLVEWLQTALMEDRHGT